MFQKGHGLATNTGWDLGEREVEGDDGDMFSGRGREEDRKRRG
jgi:hypothetical protein